MTMSGKTRCPRCSVEDAYYEHQYGTTFFYDCQSCGGSGEIEKDVLFSDHN